MSNALENIMDQAKQAADNFVAQPPAVTSPTAVQSVQNTSGLPRTLADAANNSGIIVDEYLVVKEEGLKIGKEMKGLVEELTVVIDMSDVTPIAQLRVNVGGNTSFYKSYNGSTLSNNPGRTLQQEADRAAAISGAKVDQYMSFEIPMELTEDVVDPKDKGRVFEEGTEVGYTPSVTGVREFERFMKKLQRQDPALLEERLKVKVAHKKRTNSNNNEWGVVTFEFIEIAD